MDVVSKSKNAKMKVVIGGASFSGEGEQSWLAEQLDKVLGIFSTLTKENPEVFKNAVPKEADPDVSSVVESKAVGSLVAYLKASDGMTNQTQRFLATAAWLRKKGAETTSTSDVSKALKDNHQTKLSNPSECLNQNVSKGFCEKNGKGFFITPEGWEKLGDSI